MFAQNKPIFQPAIIYFTYVVLQKNSLHFFTVKNQIKFKFSKGLTYIAHANGEWLNYRMSLTYASSGSAKTL